MLNTTIREMEKPQWVITSHQSEGLSSKSLQIVTYNGKESENACAVTVFQPKRAYSVTLLSC